MTTEIMTDKAIPGIPNQLVVLVGLTVESLTDSELATFILCGTGFGKIQPDNNGYDKVGPLIENDDTIRGDILECVQYWASKRPAFCH